ncbi:MAG TPA: type II toxin-antitoxin system VapC family toxin [Stellaceae bacterium]|jgi:predicted nucleic-acid-binding protein|nr:type II toxin-antitoxin system VapC family toxin [Stellaceae bacterium]
MKVTADTNVLVRAAVLDEPSQAERAAALLRDAELIVVTLPTLCEFAWVLRGAYRWTARDIFGFIRSLIASPAVRADQPAVEAGLAMLDAGGDFADGVIAFMGRQMGGMVFASFDRKAVALVAAAGGETLLLEA